MESAARTSVTSRARAGLIRLTPPRWRACCASGQSRSSSRRSLKAGLRGSKGCLSGCLRSCSQGLKFRQTTSALLPWPHPAARLPLSAAGWCGRTPIRISPLFLTLTLTPRDVSYSATELPLSCRTPLRRIRSPCIGKRPRFSRRRRWPRCPRPLAVMRLALRRTSRFMALRKSLQGAVSARMSALCLSRCARVVAAPIVPKRPSPSAIPAREPHFIAAETLCFIHTLMDRRMSRSTLTE